MLLRTVIASVVVLAVLGADRGVQKLKSTPLFDGKTLKGWRVIGQGQWKVEDGAIVGRNVPGPFREGPFALQVHGGQEVEVRFKTIELLDEGASK